MELFKLLKTAELLTLAIEYNDWLAKGKADMRANQARTAVLGPMYLQRKAESLALRDMAQMLVDANAELKSKKSGLKLDVPEIKKLWDAALADLEAAKAEYTARTDKNNALDKEWRRTANEIRAAGKALYEITHAPEEKMRRAAIKAKLQEPIRLAAAQDWANERLLDDLTRMAELTAEIVAKLNRVAEIEQAQNARRELLCDIAAEEPGEDYDKAAFVVKMANGKWRKAHAAELKAAEEAALLKQWQAEEDAKQAEAQRKFEIGKLMDSFPGCKTNKEVAELSDLLMSKGADRYAVEDAAETAYLRIKHSKPVTIVVETPTATVEVIENMDQVAEVAKKNKDAAKTALQQVEQEASIYFTPAQLARAARKAQAANTKLQMANDYAEFEDSGPKGRRNRK